MATALLVCAALSLGIAPGLLFYTFSDSTDDNSTIDLFHTFITKFKRPYSIGSSEYYRRFHFFKESLQRHERLNSAVQNRHAAKFGVTKFSDLAPEEFASNFLNRRIQSQRTADRTRGPTHNWAHGLRTSLQNEKLKEIPQKFDWAFSVTETVESMYAIKTKNLTEFSIQQVIDCALGGAKCQGGDICHTAKWLKEYQVFITTENQYPLTDTNEICRMEYIVTNGHRLKTDKISIIRVSGAGQEMTELVEKIANHGPVAVQVDAALWQDYLGGIIQHHCDGPANHAVQVVGYDLTGEVPYYIVRNSWGDTWGHDGYLYIKVGDDTCVINGCRGTKSLHGNRDEFIIARKGVVYRSFSSFSFSAATPGQTACTAASTYAVGVRGRIRDDSTSTHFQRMRKIADTLSGLW